MTTTATLQDYRDSARYHFLQRAMQYYVVGRTAALAQMLPVCGNLFHQAVEMFLKAQLSRKLEEKSLDELKSHGHKLVQLWDAFKADLPTAVLAPFDDTIASLEEFWDVRYPDTSIEKGSQLVMQWQRTPFVAGLARGPKPPLYQVAVSDIDKLVATILDVSSVNADAFTGAMNDYALDAIARDNAVARKLSEVQRSAGDANSYRGVVPEREPGESFGTYWSRLTDVQVLAITRAMRWIGITTPQGFWESYIPKRK